MTERSVKNESAIAQEIAAEIVSEIKSTGDEPFTATAEWLGELCAPVFGRHNRTFDKDSEEDTRTVRRILEQVSEFLVQAQEGMDPPNDAVVQIEDFLRRRSCKTLQ